MNKMKFTDKLYCVIGFIWLLFMLMFPSDFQEVKYITLIILLVISSFEFLITKKTINKKLFFGIYIWITYFALSLSFGFFKGYSLDFPLINIYFITPIAALLLSTTINNKERFIFLNKMLILITFMIVTLDIVYILNKLSVIPLPFNFNSPIFGSSVISNQKLEFRITNQSSLIFLLPYIVALIISPGYRTKKEKYLIFITIFFGVIVTLLSGRRSFFAIVGISIPLVTVLLKFKQGKINLIKRKNPIKRLGQILILIVVIIGSYNWLSKTLGLESFMYSVNKTFLSAFDSSTSSGAIRAKQSSMLIEGWSSSFLTGHGLNSYLNNYIRSGDTPWSYEWVYIAMIYQTGIIGISVFFCSVYSISKKLYKKVDFSNLHTGTYFLGILVGFICFIIAGSSNPMVYYIWAWSFALIGYQQH